MDAFNGRRVLLSMHKCRAMKYHMLFESLPESMVTIVKCPGLRLMVERLSKESLQMEGQHVEFTWKLQFYIEKEKYITFS